MCRIYKKVVKSGFKWLYMKKVGRCDWKMFMGEYQHTLDVKGRIIFPVKFREQLGASFVATKGLDGCLFVYDNQEWQILEAKLKQLPTTSKDARAFARFFFSGAVQLECDKLGRVLLPASLREYAKLSKDIVTIGVGSRIEIWDNNIWTKYNEESDEAVSNIAEQLVSLGI